MSENKFKHIKFKDYITYFDDYFDYLETIKTSIPKKFSSFFSNHSRYKLQKEESLHNAWVEKLQIENVYVDNEKSTKVELTLLLAHNNNSIKLIYYNVSDIIYEQVPLKWSNKAVDLITHEFSIISKDSYQHILQFDRGVWLLIVFEDFDYEDISQI